MNGFDWLGLMKGITEAHMENLGLGSPAGEKGFSGGVEGHATAIEGATYSEAQVTSQRIRRYPETDAIADAESGVGDRGSENLISPADSQTFASPAPASEDALAGTGGGVDSGLPEHCPGSQRSFLPGIQAMATASSVDTGGGEHPKESSPLHLLASGIVDKVERGRQ